MRKIVIISSFFLLSLLLASCMSFSGSAKEETNTKEENELESKKVDEVEELEKKVKELEDKVEEKEVDKEPTDPSDSSDVKTTSTDSDSKTTGDCEDDYSVFIEELPDDFPMPECAIVGDVLVDNKRVDASYEVEDDWSDLYSFYKDYFGENITEQNQTLDEGKGKLLGDIDGGKLNIEVKQLENNNAKVRAFYKFP